MSLVQEKQKELKDCIKKIGMTQKYFIEQYCIETFNNFTEKEIQNYYEKFKKEITRKTTKVQILDTYLNFLYSSEEFEKTNHVSPFLVRKQEIFDEEFYKKMGKISSDITKMIKNKNP